MAIPRSNLGGLHSSEDSHQEDIFQMPAYVIDVAMRFLQFYPDYKDKEWQKTPQQIVQIVNSTANYLIRPFKAIFTGSTPAENTQILTDMPAKRRQTCQLLITDLSTLEDSGTVDEWIEFAIKLGDKAYDAASLENGMNFCNFLHAIRSLVVTALLQDEKAKAAIKAKIVSLKSLQEKHEIEISKQAAKGHDTSELEKKQKQAIFARAYLEDDDARLKVSHNKNYLGMLPSPAHGDRLPNGHEANSNFNLCLQNEYYLSFFEQYILAERSPIKNAKSSKYKRLLEEFEKYKHKKGKYSNSKNDAESSEESDEVTDSSLQRAAESTHHSSATVPSLAEFIYKSAAELAEDTSEAAQESKLLQDDAVVAPQEIPSSSSSSSSALIQDVLHKSNPDNTLRDSKNDIADDKPLQDPGVEQPKRDNAPVVAEIPKGGPIMNQSKKNKKGKQNQGNDAASREPAPKPNI